MKHQIQFTPLLLAGVVPLAAQTTFNGTTGAIPDNQCPSFTEFTANVSGLPAGGVKVHAVTVNISHPFTGDLSRFIGSPSGVLLELSTANGGGTDNYTDTVFSDAGATFITAGTAPLTGTSKTEGRAAALV